jgi:hypothetical protein
MTIGTLARSPEMRNIFILRPRDNKMAKRKEEESMTYGDGG